jgi:transcriptional regulator with XRE-family HTH domain
MKDLKHALAANLRRKRYARGWTQEELADRVGISSRYIGAIERAQVSASVTVLGRLADTLDADPAELVLRHSRRSTT